MNQTANYTIGAGNTSKETFFWNHSSRIRQTGLCKQWKVYIGSTSAWDTLYVKIWSSNLPTKSTFQLRNNTSFKLAASDASVGINTITLATPIPLREGDYYSVRIYKASAAGTPANFIALEANAATATYTVLDANPGTASAGERASYNWKSKTASPGAFLCDVEFYMMPPQIVWIGYSHIAGHNLHYSFAESASVALDTTATDLSNNVAARFAALRPGVTWQNMGIGGETTSQIQARAYRHVYRLKPRVVIIQLGGNDQPNSVWSSTYRYKLQNMIDSLNTNGIVGVFVKTVQQSGMSDAWATQIDSTNVMAENIIRDRCPNCFIVDARYAMSTFRAGDPPGNRWGSVAEYSVGDSLHWNATGQAAFANTINNELSFDPAP